MASHPTPCLTSTPIPFRVQMVDNRDVADPLREPGEDDGTYRGLGSRERLEREFLNKGSVSYVAVRADGTVVYASETSEQLLGKPAAETVGGNVIDWIHPEDAARAVLQLTELSVVGSSPGTSLFRVKNAEGSWVPVEVMGSMVSDGAEDLFGLYARYAGHQLFLEQLLGELVGGAERDKTLRIVCDGVDWQLFESNVAIAWSDDEGTHQVSTGVPPELGGADYLGDTPWERCRWSGVAEQGSAADLDDGRREKAEQLDFGAFWVEPVQWSPGRPAATITIWTAAGPRAPAIHAYGMGVVRELVELVLRWTENTELLDRAARSDPLTGLANHRAFFTALGEAAAGGAVLYLDLDHFKPVNDDLGHTAGDTVLRVAARRIEGCVRDDDVVGRLGGDEFAVLCVGLSEKEGVVVAERILEVLHEPFRVGEIGEVRISASIGVAASHGPMSEGLLQAADRALSAAKTAGRGRVCLASES
jgi:diguanylate cyclase (GGDEF)-like protein/PAS domain S-box-containing protein